MIVRDVIAQAIAFSDGNIVARALAAEGVTLRWPTHWTPEEVDQHRRTADAAIETYHALMVVEGFRVVPMVPNKKMRDAGADMTGELITVSDTYREMVAKAPNKWPKDI